MAMLKWNINNITDQAGKVIVNTGSTSGLGQEAAKQLAGKNANLYFTYKLAEKLKEDPDGPEPNYKDTREFSVF